MQKNIIAAVADNMAIGRDNELLWHISADMKYFRRVTMGCPIIMGYKTWLSIGRPLPGRKNIVITKSDFDAPENVVQVPDVAAALAAAAIPPTRNLKRPRKLTRKTAFNTPSRCTSERRDYRGIPRSLKRDASTPCFWSR